MHFIALAHSFIAHALVTGRCLWLPKWEFHKLKLVLTKNKTKTKKTKKISKTIFNTLHHLHFLKYKTLFLFLFDTIRHDSEKINYVRIICLCRLSMHPLCPIRYDEISPGRHVYLQLSSLTVLMDCLYKESFGKVLSNTPPINISAFPIKQKKNLKTPLET